MFLLEWRLQLDEVPLGDAVVFQSSIHFGLPLLLLRERFRRQVGDAHLEGRLIGRLELDRHSCTQESSLIFFMRRKVAEGADRSTSLIQATVTPMRLWPLAWP